MLIEIRDPNVVRYLKKRYCNYRWGRMRAILVGLQKCLVRHFLLFYILYTRNNSILLEQDKNSEIWHFHLTSKFQLTFHLDFNKFNENSYLSEFSSVRNSRIFICVFWTDPTIHFEISNFRKKRSRKILSWACMSSFGMSVSDVNEIFGRCVNQGTRRRRPGAHFCRLAQPLAPPLGPTLAPH